MGAGRDRGERRIGAGREGGEGRIGVRREGGEGRIGVRREGGEGRIGVRREGGEGRIGVRREGGEGRIGVRREGGEGRIGAGREGGEGRIGVRREGGEGRIGVRREGGEGRIGVGREEGEGRIGKEGKVGVEDIEDVEEPGSAKLVKNDAPKQQQHPKPKDHPLHSVSDTNLLSHNGSNMPKAVVVKSQYPFPSTIAPRVCTNWHHELASCPVHSARHCTMPWCYLATGCHPSQCRRHVARHQPRGKPLCAYNLW